MAHILDRIISSQFLKLSKGYSESQLNLIKRFSRAEFLMADNIYEYFWKHNVSAHAGGVTIEANLKSFPNSAPPWNDVFVGFTDKVRCDTRGANWGFRYTEGGGCFISTRALKDKQESDVIQMWEQSEVTRPDLYKAGVRWVSYATPIVSWRGIIQPPMGYVVFHITEDGSMYCMPWGHHDIRPTEDDPDRGASSGFYYMGFIESNIVRYLSHVYKVPVDTELGEAEGWLQEIAPAALLAFSFIHCRNVEMIDNSRRKGMGKRLRVSRKNADRIVFKTIKIESIKRILATDGDIDNNGLGVALHLCRGHFKDYRNGTGLFGRHRDIYWWDEQWRGDQEYGTILKDYESPDVVDGVLQA